MDSPVIGRRDRSLESGFSWAVPADGTDSLNRHGFDYAYRALAALERALEILRHEISSTMANIGCASVADITPGHVRWSIASPPT